MPRAMKSKGTEGGSTGQPEKTWGRDVKENEGGAGMFANQGEFPCLPALQVNFAPVGYLCDNERAPTVFTRRGDGRPPSVRCALVIPRARLREPDNKIWAPLGRSWQKLTSPLTQWCDPKSLWGVTSHNLSLERAREGGFNSCIVLAALYHSCMFWPVCLMNAREWRKTTQKRRNDIKDCAPPVSRGRSQDVNQTDGAERGETVWDRWGLKGEDTNSPSSSELLSFRSKDVETFKV